MLVGLAGCSKDPVPSATANESVKTERAKTVLSPIFAAAEECLGSCVSEWWSVTKDDSESAVSSVNPELPLGFANFLESTEDNRRFVELVEQFPKHLQPLGILQADDKEKIVNNGIFGSVKRESPKMHGWLQNIFKVNGRTIYIYSGVKYFRIGNEVDVSGTMNVAVDPAKRELAGLIRANPNLDDYYIEGTESLRGPLVAFTAADDLNFAEMRVHYLNKNPGSYISKPIIFPLHKDREEALARITVLNNTFKGSSHAKGVPEPDFLRSALAAQAEKAWYAVSQGRDSCAQSPMSPADRLEVIREAGVVPRIQEKASGGKLSFVEISAVNGGYENTWQFFKNKAECEQTLGNAAPVPDRYR